MDIEKLIKELQQDISKVEQREIQIEQTQRLAEIMSVYNGEDQVVTFREIAAKIKVEPAQVRMTTGFSKFDEILKGFREQQVIVLSGFTKHGKTSFAMELSRRLEEHNPLWFPFEQSAQELVSIMIERGDPIPHGYTPENYKVVMLDWIEKKIVEAKVKYNTKVVFIDHIDFIVPFTTDNHALRVSQTMRDLKGIAKRWDVAIVVLCHLVKTKMDTNPTLEDIKGSSSIAQEADTVILVWRETKKEGKETIITNNTNIAVLANRRQGTTGNIKMVFENGRYYEREWIDFGEYEDNKLKQLL